jgi:phosphoglycerate dehydrogenase-like enzyme
MARASIRVHIENARGKHPIFHVTEERWRAACARHRALARRLEASIGWDGDVLEEALRTAQIVIGVPARRERLAERAPRLRWLHATSAGVDSLLPLDWLPRGVVLTNNRGAHGAKAREYARMAYALLHTRMPELLAQQRARVWRPLFTPALAGRTALVVGLGDLGRAAARAARDLGMRVIGVSRSGRKVREADAVYRLGALDRLLARADFVVLAVPLTPETRGLFDRARLDRMKRSAGLVNICRGAVLDQEALREKLERGEIAGAVLDVVEPEPLPPDSPLWETRNLVLTPHVSCDDGERYVEITLDLWFANLARFLEGRPLAHRVDPRRGY